MKTILLLVASLLVASLLVAGCGGGGEEGTDLDDPKVREKILKEAVNAERLELRGPALYQAGKPIRYTGWVKKLYGNGQVFWLGHYKDGKLDGPFAGWLENGKKVKQTRYKNGVEVKE